MINKSIYNSYKTITSKGHEKIEPHLNPSSNSITITNPTSLDAWISGTTQTIKWRSSGDISYIGINLFKGAVYNEIIALITKNDGSYDWLIPSYLADDADYQIRIFDFYSSIVSNNSDYFEIYSYIEQESITITSPINSSSWVSGTTQTITWTSTGSIPSVDIALFKGGSFDNNIIFSTPNDGIYTWFIPNNLNLSNRTDYQIKISYSGRFSVSNYSDYFEIYTYIEPKSITITNPTNLDRWGSGTIQTIAWTSTGNITNVKIDLYLSDVYIKTLIANTYNDGSYSWTLSPSLVNSSLYHIKVIDASKVLIFDDSPYFKIISSIDDSMDDNSKLKDIPGCEVIVLSICLIGVSVVFIKICLKRTSHN